MRQFTIGNEMNLVVNWLREQKRQSTLCRSCDLEVAVTETVCPRCGASDPVRVPMSAATAVFAFAACIIVAALTIAY